MSFMWLCWSTWWHINTFTREKWETRLKKKQKTDDTGNTQDLRGEDLREKGGSQKVIDTVHHSFCPRFHSKMFAFSSSALSKSHQAKSSWNTQWNFCGLRVLGQSLAFSICQWRGTQINTLGMGANHGWWTCFVFRSEILPKSAKSLFRLY